MKSASKLAALLVLGTGLAGCGGIGDGSTIETLQIAPAGLPGFDQGALIAADELTQTPETFRMYDCFCSNLAAVATFTDGTAANFSLRTTWTSSDTNVVRVLNTGETETACPGSQRAAGLVVPVGPGDATLRVSFAGLEDTIEVHVESTPAGALTLAPSDDSNAGHVAVGATLPLAITATLDNRPRALTGNVTTWAFDPADDTVATISAGGVVSGVARDQGVAQVARASFGTCAVSPTRQIRVGEVVGPMALSHESGFTDDKLAEDTSEDFKAVAALDFGGGSPATGEQDLSGLVRMDYEQACTLRSFDDTTAACVDTPGTCTASTAVCTSCASGMASCRVEELSFAVPVSKRVIAVAPSAQPATFHAVFPAAQGTATTLAAGIDAAATAITVAALSGYPSTVPWDGVIEAGTGNAEVVRVTAVDGTALTVTRGIGGAATAHAQDAAFEQRSFQSDTENLTAVAGTFDSVTIDAAAATLPAYGTQQFGATGQFLAENRTQPVTRLTAAANVVTWSTSLFSLAGIGSNTGKLTTFNGCGGRLAVRIRSAASDVTDTASFVTPSDTEPDADDNSNADSNDTACLATDPLCDQVNVCIERADPLPPGVVCEDPAPAC